MPVYDVTDPTTGLSVSLTGDSPPTEQELEGIFSQLGGAQSAQAHQPQQPMQQQAPATGRGIAGQRTQQARSQELANMSPEQRALVESIGPAEAALIGAGRGFTNVGRGVGLIDEATAGEDKAFQNLKTASPIAAGAGEIIGEAAPFVPLGVGAAGLATLPARAAASTAIGALEGGILTAGKGGDAGDIAKGSGIGAAVAGGLELALPVVGRIGGKLIRKVTGKAPKSPVINANGQPSTELRAALDETGLTFDDLNAESKRLFETGDISDEAAAARKMFLEERGITPTRAQITGDATDFQSQQELFKTSGKVRRALEGQEDVLSSQFENAITATGGSANASRSSAMDFIADRSIDLDRSISDAYKAAREAAPTAKIIKPTGLIGSIRSVAGSDNATGGLASATRDILKQRGVLGEKGLKPQGKINAEVAEGIRQDLNGLYDSLTPFGRQKLAGFKDALDNDVSEAIGEDVFEGARSAKAKFEKDLSRSRVNKFDKRKKNIVRDILENKVNPDRFLNDAVLSKSIRSDDVDQLKRFLLIDGDEAGQAAWNDLRAEAMQKIKSDAVNEVGGQSFITQKRLKSAMDRFGRDKLDVLFEPEERKFLDDMLKVTRIREPKAGTQQGLGPSAQAIGRIEQALKRIPLAGDTFEGIESAVSGRIALSQPSLRKPLAPSRLTQGLVPAAIPAALQAEEE
jgi:hypothetical protein